MIAWVASAVSPCGPRLFRRRAETTSGAMWLEWTTLPGATVSAMPPVRAVDACCVESGSFAPMFAFEIACAADALSSSTCLNPAVCVRVFLYSLFVSTLFLKERFGLGLVF